MAACRAGSRDPQGFVRAILVSRAGIMAKQLPRQIDGLKQKILFVGTLVEEAIAKAISALINRDRNLANTVIEADTEIDRMEVDVEEEVLKILALYQPVAADLRFVVAVLKINNDLERMGDLARNIAKRVVFLANCERFDLPVDFRGMATRAQSMVKESLDALVNSDTLLAQKVRESDDDVDARRRTIEKEIEQQIASHPERTDCLMRLSSVARHLERIADMATNIAEDVIYMVEGEIVRHHRATETME
jgi:phosphate transport system protein